MFELVQESHTSHPELCVKALQALLNILEGQQPQGLRKDNSIILGKSLHKKISYNSLLKGLSIQFLVLSFLDFPDSVFNVLLKLSNCEMPARAGSSKCSTVSGQLQSVATSCLISFAIARGDTKSLLEVILTLLKCEKSYISQELMVRFNLKLFKA